MMPQGPLPQFASCRDIYNLLGVEPRCCDSCHVDANEHGYPLGDEIVNGCRISCCCGASEVVKEARLDSGHSPSHSMRGTGPA